MKKTIIKNWIKYSASTLAVSGLLVMGACGDSTENEIETAETEIVAPPIENVAEVEPELEESNADLAAAESEEVETTTTRSNELGATFIRDMDAFLEEHKEVNQQITAALIDSDSNLDAGSTPESIID